MNLGISGRTALLCASNAGLGLACAKALAVEGVDVVINGRKPDKIAAAITEVEAVATGKVFSVQADVASDEGRKALLDTCPNPDILLNNNAGPKPKRFMETERQDWEETYQANYLAPILLVHAVLPGMIDRGFGRIINITSAMVTTPRPHHTIVCILHISVTLHWAAFAVGLVVVIWHNVQAKPASVKQSG